METCEYYQELVSASLDEETSPEEEQALHAHLRSCPDCRRYYTALSSIAGITARDLPEPPAELTERIMASVREAPAPVDFTGRIMDQVREAAPPSKKKAVILRFPTRTMALAAAFALVMLGGWGGLRHLRQRAASVIPPTTANVPEVTRSPNAVVLEIADEDVPLSAGKAKAFRLRLGDKDGKILCEGSDTGELAALLQDIRDEVPVPEEPADYTLTDEGGAVLWQIWQDGDFSVCLQGEQETAYALETGVLCDVLGAEF